MFCCLDQDFWDYYFLLWHVEELFRGVVLADGVLEGEVESVVLLHHLVAAVLVLPVALELAALAVDVHVHVVGQDLGVSLATGLQNAE